MNERNLLRLQKSQRKPTGYAIQNNFLNLIERPECKILGMPSRTRQDFWREDVLPTSILLRQIYVGNYQSEEGAILESIWQWLKDGNNRTFINESSLGDQGAVEKMPDFVILNYQTVLFFTMEEDFKDFSGGLKICVSFLPNCDDWKNDVRRITLPDYEKLRTHPFELGKMEYTESIVDYEVVSRRLRGYDYGSIQRWERTDTITWALLMRYHLELVKREKIGRDILQLVK